MADADPLVVDGLVKSYGDVRAVDGVSLRVPRGHVVCLLGANGAGKTTTLEIAQGVRRATAGSARLFGEDAWGASADVKRRMGVLPQRFTGFPHLTVRENVQYFADIYDAEPDIPTLLADLGLAEDADRRFATLSGGTMRRVALATSLVNDPDLLFLDEPAAGVDPANRRRIWSLIEGLRRRDRAILLTTHAMDEAERLADHVVVVRRGRVVADGAPENVRRTHGGGTVLRVRGVPDPLPEPLARRAGVTREADGSVTVALEDATDGPLLVTELVKAGVPFQEISLREPTLDDAFVRLADAADEVDA